MEVGQESIDNLVAVTRIEERVSHALLRLHDSVRIGDRLDDAGTRGANRHDAATFAFSLVDDFGVFLGELVMFAVHLVLRKVLDRDILEGSAFSLVSS